MLSGVNNFPASLIHTQHGNHVVTADRIKSCIRNFRTFHPAKWTCILRDKANNLITNSHKPAALKEGSVKIHVDKLHAGHIGPERDCPESTTAITRTTETERKKLIRENKERNIESTL